MRRVTFGLLLMALFTVGAPLPNWAQVPAPAGGAKPSMSEVLISTLSDADIAARLAAGETIDHVAEVVRGKPVVAVVRSPSCQKDPSGACRVSAEIVVYQPDGAAYRKADVQAGTGNGTAPLTFDAQAPAGMYRIVATVRDLVSRQFVTVERRFAVK